MSSPLRSFTLALALVASALPVLAQPAPPVPPVPPAPAVAPAAPAPDDGAPADDHDSKASRRGRGRPDDRVSIGGSVEVKEGESVTDAVAILGNTTVGGHVRGDAVAIGGALKVKNTAHIEGDAVAIGGPVEVEDGAVIDGQRVSIGGFLGSGGFAVLAGGLGTLALVWALASAAFQILGLLALGSLFVAFLPKRIDRMKEVLVARPGPSAGVGVLAFLGLVPATVLLAITIIGLLLVPFLWMFAGVLIALGLTIVAQLIGEKFPLTGKWRGPFVTLGLGALVLALVRFVPVVGALVSVAAMVLGVGAALLTRFGAEPPNPEPNAPPQVPSEPMLPEVPPEA